MATLICNGTGNLTGSTTFAGAETGALALNLIRNTTSSLATAASVTSATFTVTTGKVIDGVLLWLQTSGTVGTGTFKVDLQKSAVSQASVTVNKSDLPDSTNSIPVPVFFKFTGTATGDGAATWTLVLTTTSGTGSATITYNINAAGATNLTRALRTTTAATPAAADDLYIVGELTGAGTHTSRTVTMNSTAATAYGNGSVNSTTVSGGLIAVSNYGTLSYGTTASTNYILRIAGDLIVYQFGTLNIGASGAEIPRNSTAVLEFQPVSANGDFGLRCLANSTVTGFGLSRTSAKNIVKCKLTADVTAATNVAATNSLGLTNGTSTTSAPDASGSLLGTAFTDTVTNATHICSSAATITFAGTTTMGVWLSRGTNTNNRFVRLFMGYNNLTAGCFIDADLQLGTLGTGTLVGIGTYTSSSITAVNGGYWITLTGAAGGTAQFLAAMVQACSAAGTTSYAGTASGANFNIDRLTLVQASSISAITFNVDTDTGWLSGDVVCVASTTRTAAQCGTEVLNANAGASSFTSLVQPYGSANTSTIPAGFTQSGTSPTQAEVGLLTRNVKIRSTSTTLMTYVYCTALASVTFSWVEFYYIGNTGNVNKRGIEIDSSATTATAKSITFCSMHDTSQSAFTTPAGANTSLNITFSNNVLCFSISSGLLTIGSAISAGDWTLDNNLLMKATGIGYNLNSLSGIFTNNTAAGCTTIGMSFTDTTSGPAPVMGAFTGNVAHSCGTFGVSISSIDGVAGTFGLTAWRNNNTGLSINPGSGNTSADIIFNNLTLFGNLSQNLSITGLGTDVLTITGTCTIAGDTTFSTAVGIQCNTSSSSGWYVDISGVDFSGTGTGLAAHTTSDLAFAGATFTVNPRGVVNNCKFGAATVLTKTLWGQTSFISFEKYNRTAGDHRTEMTYGQLKSDSTFFNLSSPSLRMTPNNATNKLVSAPKYNGFVVACASGSSVNVACYIYKSKTGDGAAYNGNQPRLIQRANAALGQTADVVLATYSSGTGSWNQISGNTSTATDDGCWEIIVDCDGTAGWINVDDFQAA